jgi:hypothetical protein
MSTSINFVTKHKNILFIAEVRGDGGNTTGYNSTSTESYIADMFTVVLGVSLLVLIVCLTVLVFQFYTSKEIFFTTF